MYLTRKDLLDRGWELVDVQKFQHDSIKKSETGRGRPSYLYLFSRVEQKEKGLQVDPSELEKIASLPVSVTPIDVCNKPKEISEPSTFAELGAQVFNKIPLVPKPVAVIEPSKWLNVAPEIVPKAVKAENPNAIKVDRNSLPKGKIRVILVDSEGNESLADLSQAA